jgi:hypothetical protein
MGNSTGKEEGISKYWTPGREMEFEHRLEGCRTFAERHLVMLTRDVLKYDGRSKAAKAAIAQARLRLAVASDKDLEEMAELEARMQKDNPGEIPGFAKAIFRAQKKRELQNTRAKIQQAGIEKEKIVCQ